LYTAPALSNPKTSISIPKRHPSTEKLNSETSGNIKNAFLHCGDVTEMSAGHPDLGKLAREVVAKVGKSGDCEEGVCPVWVNPHSGQVHGDKLSLGSRGDSYYEYLLKHWILTGKTDDALLK